MNSSQKRLFIRDVVVAAQLLIPAGASPAEIRCVAAAQLLIPAGASPAEIRCVAAAQLLIPAGASPAERLNSSQKRLFIRDVVVAAQLLIPAGTSPAEIGCVAAAQLLIPAGTSPAEIGCVVAAQLLIPAGASPAEIGCVAAAQLLIPAGASPAEIGCVVAAQLLIPAGASPAEIGCLVAAQSSLPAGTSPAESLNSSQKRLFIRDVVVAAQLLIPAGASPAEIRTFTMGSPENEAGRFEDEGPQHKVTLSAGFWIFDTPCAQALWKAVMGENPSRFVDDDRPVEQVTWRDCHEFAKRLNERKEGLDLTVPTEAQWEYACRAGTTTAKYAGKITIPGFNNAPGLDPIAWYGGNSGVEFDLENGVDSSGWLEKQHNHRRAGTRKVGKKKPNAWGLYDVLGNAFEWCEDGQRRYKAYPVVDPVGPYDESADRVIRGGSWYDYERYARYARSACRLANAPGARDVSLGFRCVRVQQAGQ